MRTEEFAMGAERMTAEQHARHGNMWVRNPQTGHGMVTDQHTLNMRRERGNPIPGDPTPAQNQQHLFNPEEHDLPFHAMSPTQFAASPHVWWHGRYGEDMPSDSYAEGHEAPGVDPEEYFHDPDDEEEDDKSGYYGIHFGTRKSATDRLDKLGPGRPQSEGEYYDAERSGGPKVGNEPRIPGRLFPVTLNQHQFAGGINNDVGQDWRPHMGYDEPTSKGIFYRNEVEDNNSISAAVPEREGSTRSMSSRSGAFFNSWNDHVLGADPDTVHPMMRWAAEHMPEHTDEDYIHPDDQKAMLNQPMQHEQLFRPYSGGEREPLRVPGNHGIQEDLQHSITTKTPAIYLGNEIAGTQKLKTIPVPQKKPEQGSML